jgi:hypothetical protein
MLDETEILLTISEIAAVFVGFVALVTVVGRRSDAEPAALKLVFLHLVIIDGILTVLGGLIPIVVARYDVAVDTAWRTSSEVLLALTYCSYIAFFPWYRRVLREASLPRSVAAVAYLLEAVFQVLLLASISGIASHLAPAFYLTALAVALSQAVFAFLLLVRLLLVKEEYR